MKFNSQKLQQCFDLARPVLDSINDTKNQVSNDIKNLEKYLASLNIKDSFAIITTPSTYVADYFVKDQEVHCLEQLLWDGGIQRLVSQRIYHYYNILRCPEIGYPLGVAFDSIKDIVGKPLIEMPYNVRKRMVEEDHLIKLLSMITQKFDAYKKFDPDDSFIKESAD